MGQNLATITNIVINTICTSNAPEFKNGSIYHTGNSLLVEGSIDGRVRCITIDTGSDTTIVRPDLVQRSSIDWNP